MHVQNINLENKLLRNITTHHLEDWEGLLGPVSNPSYGQLIGEGYPKWCGSFSFLNKFHSSPWLDIIFFFQKKLTIEDDNNTDNH